MSVYIKENENLTNVLYSINNTTNDDYNIKFSNMTITFHQQSKVQTNGQIV